MIKYSIQKWKADGTKMLGTLTTIISGFILIPDLIPKGNLKWWAATNVVLGALTIKRGYDNSRRNQQNGS
jgi:hypothetical protein